MTRRSTSRVILLGGVILAIGAVLMLRNDASPASVTRDVVASPSGGQPSGVVEESIPPDEPASPVPEPPDAAIAAATCDSGAVPGATRPAPLVDQAPPGFALHVPVLMYHRIVALDRAGDALHGLVVPPDVFAAQLSGLRTAGWTTITLTTLAGDLAAGRTPPPRTFVISIDDGHDDGYTNALPILTADRFVATYFVIPGRIGHATDLTADEIRALVAAGDEIGDHTMDHLDLPSLAPAHLTYEIDAAAERIATVTGLWPATFAYPFGAFDGRVEAAVEACAPLAMAVTTDPGVSERWTDRFAVPRLRVGPGTTPAHLLAELEPFR